MRLPYAYPMTILSENVNVLLARAGGQEALATHAGVSQATISRWSKGVPPRSFEKLSGLARYAGVSVASLVHDPLEGAAEVTATTEPDVIYMPVQLPSAERLTAAMRGLIEAIGLGDQADTYAETLARHLPGALAQAAAPLAPPESGRGYSHDEPAPDRATRRL